MSWCEAEQIGVLEINVPLVHTSELLSMAFMSLQLDVNKNCASSGLCSTRAICHSFAPTVSFFFRVAASSLSSLAYHPKHISQA